MVKQCDSHSLDNILRVVMIKSQEVVFYGTTGL
jgi:hypothetical protein